MWDYSQQSSAYPALLAPSASCLGSDLQFALPLLVLGTILGIMSHVATSETPVVIALTVLLPWLVVVPLNWGLRVVGCLLLLLLLDHPSSLLLRSPTLSVRHNPEALRLS
jgi:hypothetical protein